MKLAIFVLLAGFVAFSCFGAVRTANAQEGTQKISFDPGTLSISSVRGTTETRTITVTANEDLTGMSVSPVDLLGNDGNGVIESSKITIDGLPAAMKANDLATLKITIHLSGVKSGEYTGRLAIKHDTGTQDLDTTVKVKDLFVVPLLFIVLGTFIGRGIISYKEVGQQRDRALARLGNINQQLSNDPELQKVTFYSEYLQAKLKVVEDLINSKAWKAANDSLLLLEGSINRWLQYRSSWIQLFKEMSTIGENIQEIGDIQTPYLRSVNKIIDDASRTAPEETDSSTQGLQNLSDTITKAQTRLYKFRSTIANLDRVNDLINKIRNRDIDEYRNKSISLRRQLEMMDPDQIQEYNDLNSEIDAFYTEVKGSQAPTNGREVNVAMPNPVDQPGGIKLNLPAKVGNSKWAQLRLDVIPWLAYMFLVFLLAGAGFSELYIKNPTFGSNLFGDYLALLSWGLAAEATREGLSSVAKGLNLPSFQEG